MMKAQRRRERHRRATRMLLRWVGRVLTLCFALLAAAAVAVVVVLPRATHGEALTVLSGSMTPTIPVGSVVVVRPVDPGTLRVGDIATYQRTTGTADFVTHRIVAIDDSAVPTRFTFKGDANRGPDINLVSSKQIRGKVWFHVPYLGAIRDGLHGKGGPTLVVMLLLGGYAVSQLSGAWGDRRSATVSTTLDRPAVLAELSVQVTAREHGLTPPEVATQWHAILLSQDSVVFRLLLVPPVEGLAATLELLDGFGAQAVVVHPSPVTLTSRGTALPVPATAGKSPTAEGLGHAGV